MAFKHLILHRYAGEGIIVYDRQKREVICRITVVNGGASVGLDVAAGDAIGIDRDERFMEAERERLAALPKDRDQAQKLRELAAEIEQGKLEAIHHTAKRDARRERYAGKGEA